MPVGSFVSGFVARMISPFATIAAFSTVLLAASLIIYFRMPSDHLFIGGMGRSME